MSDKKDLEDMAVAEVLRQMPSATPRPEFRSALRDSLYASAREQLTPLGQRRLKRRERAVAAPRWGRVIAFASLAAAIAIALLAGPTAVEHFQTARLPKLPAAIQEQVGAAGRYGAVKEATYTLNTTLPVAPGKLKVYAPKLGQYTASEAEQIARKLGFTGPLTDISGMWRAEETPVPGSPELGRMVDVDKTEARVAYNDYVEHSGSLISDTQAVVNAKGFMQRAGLPYSADSVTVGLMSDRPQYEVQLIQRLAGYDALGFQSHVWVNQAGGAIVSSYYVRVTYEPGLTYPIKTAAQAFEDLKTQTVYAEHEQISVKINAVRLAYYNFPRMNLPTEQTVMQPVYVFTGTDNYGQPFEALVPAVPAEYRQSR